MVRGWPERAHLAVDLGTANTVVFRRGDGIVLFEPSVVAIDQRSGEVLAVGSEARRMIGRTPAHISATRPLRDGVIADFAVTEQMLRHFIRRAGSSSSRAAAMVCVPSGITQVERNAVIRAAQAAGARDAFLIEEPMAAAIGAGLPVADPLGSMVVDVGGGTTEIAVTALGGLAVVHSIRVGGYQMDDAIVRSIDQRERLLIGQEQAEALTSGMLRRTTVSSAQIRAALQRPLDLIVEATKLVLERTPAELAADLVSSGITLVGGGALLPGLAELLAAETGLPVTVADEPLTTVALGAGHALEELGALRAKRRP
jgi:rod shape-determining protein MreB and related proteins